MRDRLGKKEDHMMGRTRLQMMAMLAVGALLGYLSASGQLNPFTKTNASVKPTESGTEEKASCCNDVNKGQLLALADTKAAAAQNDGKKPNILFIMGDDIGWFNIGAYHRGMMSGKTPTLDKLAAQGMLFT